MARGTGGARRPRLKNTECPGIGVSKCDSLSERERGKEIGRWVSPFEFYTSSESDAGEEKSKSEFAPFELPTTSESDEEVISKIV